MRPSSCAALTVLLLLAPAAPAQEKLEKTAPRRAHLLRDVPPAGDAEAKLAKAPYYPLALGSSWEYKAGDNKFTLKVTKYEKVGDALCARVEMLIKDKDKEKSQSFEHVGVTDDGVYRYSFEGKEAKPPVLFFKLPPKQGETWKVDSKVGGEAVKGTFKNNGQEEVKVPAGSYKAWVVASQDLEANGVKMSVTYYIAEKVGMVKQLVEVSGQKIVIELEKYEPGPGKS
jgi:hypothetical protein